MPLAAGLDWLEGLLPILFALFWIGSQIVGVLRQAGRGGKPPARPARPVPQPPRADEVRTQLERQIEEFLGRSRPPAERPTAQRPPAADPNRGRRPVRATGKVPPPPPAVAAKPVASDRGPRAPGGGEVARHVHDAFAHQLDHLAPSLHASAGAELARPAAVAPAEELIAALRNPATLRQIILLREVLDRPVDRW